MDMHKMRLATYLALGAWSFPVSVISSKNSP